jgi:hypothetical protein
MLLLSVGQGPARAQEGGELGTDGAGGAVLYVFLILKIPMLNLA